VDLATAVEERNISQLDIKLQKDFLSLNPKPKTSIHIFDHTIKPIVLYGCEIWGTFNSNTARFRNMVICFDYIVVLIVHKHIVVKEIFLDIQVDSNSGKYFL
jgi:hypothetical protein